MGHIDWRWHCPDTIAARACRFDREASATNDSAYRAWLRDWAIELRRGDVAGWPGAPIVMPQPDGWEDEYGAIGDD